MNNDNYIKSLILVLSLLLSATVDAHDFEVNGIFYNINGSNVTVTYKGANASEYYNEYSGDIVIPSSVTFNGTTYAVASIGSEAFLNCGNLTSITIPNSITDISFSPFSSCNSLTSIVVANDNPVYDSRNNCNAIIETNSNTLISGCKNTVIPNTVVTIGSFAFSGITGLTNIEIPNSVTTINESAFEFCKGLTSIEIPNSVTTIGMSAFSFCDNLTSITIPNSITDIDVYAFSSCSSLTSIVVANDNPVYDSRNNCNAIIETGSNTLISGCKNTVIPNTVVTIGWWAFRGCSGLTNIEIPNSVTTIGYGAFSHCSGLTSIDIPNSVITIKGQAFQFCTGLKSIEISNSITKIEVGAFWGCNEVNKIICYSAIPPSCENGVFTDYSATLHVPAASLAAYFTAPIWSNFENIEGDAVAPTGLLISNDSINLQLDEQLQLRATVTPDNASNKEITWISTDSTVATVNNGLVVAVGCGECNIIASCFGMQVMCHVLVGNKVTLDQHEVMLLPNHIFTLTPTPTIPDIYIVSSSDPTVAAARVLSSGKIQVVGINEGTTTITIGSVDGLAIPATCLVTVYTESGDLNSDGFVDISDVTSLIDYLFGGNETSVATKNADVNCDGNIDIDDVTSLIDTLLSETE